MGKALVYAGFGAGVVVAVSPLAGAGLFALVAGFGLRAFVRALRAPARL